MPTVVISNNTTGADYSGTEDVHIRENAPTTNYDGVDMTVDNGSSGSEENALIRFTGLSNITGPVTVSDATLELWLVQSGAASGRSIIVESCIRAWGETTATWNTYDGTNNWTTAGALSAGNDIGASALADVATPETPTGEYRSFTSAAFIQDVEDIINGARSNDGWMLHATDTFAAWDFRRSEGTDGQRPKLTVTYTVDGGGPTYYPLETTIYV